MTSKVHVQQRLTPSLDWLTPESAPLHTKCWVTDGEVAYEATLCRDVHGAWGWRTKDGFNELRRVKVVGWQPFRVPVSPNIRPIIIEDWAEYARQLGSYCEARRLADETDPAHYMLSLHEDNPGVQGLYELAVNGYERRPCVVARRYVSVAPDRQVPCFETVGTIIFGPVSARVHVSWCTLWRKLPDEPDFRCVGYARFNDRFVFEPGTTADVGHTIILDETGERSRV